MAVAVAVAVAVVVVDVVFVVVVVVVFCCYLFVVKHPKLSPLHLDTAPQQPSLSVHRGLGVVVTEYSPSPLEEKSRILTIEQTNA